MPVIVKERPRQAGEVNFNNPRSQREFIIVGTDDRGVMAAALLAFVPTVDTFGTLFLFIEKYSFKEIGGVGDAGAWEATVNYALSPDYVEVQIDTTGGQTKLLQSLDTINSYSCDGTAEPDFKGAIGVNGENIEGVEVQIPKFVITVNKKFKLSVLSGVYVDLMRALTGTTNEAPISIVWKGQSIDFDEQELLFRGFRSKQTSDDDLDINYVFEAQNSLTDVDEVMIGDAGPINKKGWEYVWVTYRPAVDPAAFGMTRRPWGAYVEKVYPTSDFTLISM